MNTVALVDQNNHTVSYPAPGHLILRHQLVHTLYSSSPKSAILAAFSTHGFHTTASGREELFVISNTSPVAASDT